MKSSIYLSMTRAAAVLALTASAAFVHAAQPALSTSKVTTATESKTQSTDKVIESQIKRSISLQMNTLKLDMSNHINPTLKLSDLPVVATKAQVVKKENNSASE